MRPSPRRFTAGPPKGTRTRGTRPTMATLIMLAVLAAPVLACSLTANVGEPPAAESGAGVAESANAQREAAKPQDKGDFRVAYKQVKNKKNERSRQELGDDEKALEELATELNKVFALPHDVFVSFDECGEPNAFYDPNKKQVTICYELVASFYEMFASDDTSEAELDDAVGSATAFVFFHELGHALIDVLDLPVTGREEDAVDQLSTIILADGSDEGAATVLYGAITFAQESEEELSALDFADEHSLNQQRFYNIICLLYGQDEKKNASLVKDGLLPKERAERCPEEFARADKAWSTLLAPHLK